MSTEFFVRKARAENPPPKLPFWTLERAAGAIFAVALLGVLSMSLSTQRSIERLNQNAAEADRGREFLTLLTRVFAAVSEAESAQRGLLLTQDERLLPIIAEARATIDSDRLRLRRNRVAVTEEHQTNVTRFLGLLEDKMRFVEEVVAVDRTNQPAALQMVREGRGVMLMAELRRELAQIQSDVVSGGNERSAFASSQADRTLQYFALWIAVDFLLLTSAYFFIKHELSHRRKTEHELAIARDAAVASTKMKSEFLAMMSHEIRTPMNGVIGMTGLLLDTPLNGEQRRMAESVQLSANALLTIINDILDYSKIEAGRMSFEEIDFDLRPVVESAMDLFAHQAREKGLSVSCHIDANVPARVRGDAGRLRQILVNLVGNAVKFTNKGEVTVHAQRAEDRIAFAVRDTGIGIPRDAIPRLFQAFTQADSSTTRTFGGTGLGLAISRRLVAAMGGEMTVESQVGKGSTFRFTVKMPEVAAVAREVEARAAPAPNAHKLRILVAEDNRVNQMVTLGQLQKLGHRADVAANGLEVLDALRRIPYDVILMDCQMPEMDGFEATRRIRESEGQTGAGRIRIVAMTANAMEGDRERCLAAGMDEYLSKPVQTGQLQAVLDQSPAARTAENLRLDDNALAELRDVSSGGSMVLAQVINAFLEDAPVNLKRLKEGLRAGDAGVVADRAHALKGSARLFGARELGDLLSTIEEQGRAGDISRVRELIPSVDEAFEAAVEQLREELLK